MKSTEFEGKKWFLFAKHPRKTWYLRWIGTSRSLKNPKQNPDVPLPTRKPSKF
jgi:hypothetical protein